MTAGHAAAWAAGYLEEVSAMPILTVVSDTPLRSEDADDRLDGEELRADVFGVGRAASMASEAFEDDLAREPEPCVTSVSDEDVAHWFG